MQHGGGVVSPPASQQQGRRVDTPFLCGACPPPQLKTCSGRTQVVNLVSALSLNSAGEDDAAQPEVGNYFCQVEVYSVKMFHSKQFLTDHLIH